MYTQAVGRSGARSRILSVLGGPFWAVQIADTPGEDGNLVADDLNSICEKNQVQGQELTGSRNEALVRTKLETTTRHVRCNMVKTNEYCDNENHA